MDDRYLFKAKQKDWRELPKEKWWVIGHYVETDGIPCIYKLQGNEDAQRIYRGIDENTLCQCTGLKDKYGTLIWENDIINTKVGKAIVGWRYTTWEIKWVRSTIWRKDLWYWVNKEGWGTEIIGNIFDNPELLEVKR